MASCKEMAALLACPPADLAALHQCTQRIQEMATRLKGQHERGLLASDNVSAAKELKSAAMAVWSWCEEQAHKSSGAEDLHAARESPRSLSRTARRPSTAQRMDEEHC